MSKETRHCKILVVRNPRKANKKLTLQEDLMEKGLITGSEIFAEQQQLPAEMEISERANPFDCIRVREVPSGGLECWAEHANVKTAMAIVDYVPYFIDTYAGRAKLAEALTKFAQDGEVRFITAETHLMHDHLKEREKRLSVKNRVLVIDKTAGAHESGRSVVLKRLRQNEFVDRRHRMTLKSCISDVVGVERRKKYTSRSIYAKVGDCNYNAIEELVMEIGYVCIKGVIHVVDVDNWHTVETTMRKILDSADCFAVVAEVPPIKQDKKETAVIKTNHYEPKADVEKMSTPELIDFRKKLTQQIAKSVAEDRRRFERIASQFSGVSFPGIDLNKCRAEIEFIPNHAPETDTHGNNWAVVFSFQNEDAITTIYFHCDGVTEDHGDETITRPGVSITSDPAVFRGYTFPISDEWMKFLKDGTVESIVRRVYDEFVLDPRLK